MESTVNEHVSSDLRLDVASIINEEYDLCYEDTTLSFIWIVKSKLTLFKVLVAD